VDETLSWELQAGAEARQELAEIHKDNALEGAYSALYSGDENEIANAVFDLVASHGPDDPTVTQFMAEWGDDDPEAVFRLQQNIAQQSRNLQATAAAQRISANEAEIARLQEQAQVALGKQFEAFLKDRPEAASEETALRMAEMARVAGINPFSDPANLDTSLRVLHEMTVQDAAAERRAGEHEGLLNALPLLKTPADIRRFNETWGHRGYRADGSGHIHVNQQMDTEALTRNAMPRQTKAEWAEAEGERLRQVWSSRPSVRDEVFGKREVAKPVDTRRERTPPPDFYEQQARYARGEDVSW
jgi:hypothetical protein